MHSLQLPDPDGCCTYAIRRGNSCHGGNCGARSPRDSSSRLNWPSQTGPEPMEGEHDPGYRTQGVAAPDMMADAGWLLDDSGEAGQVRTSGNSVLICEEDSAWNPRRGRSSTSTGTRTSTPTSRTSA